MPHFHARFTGAAAVFDLAGNCIDGDIGQRAARLVREWCAERRAELEVAWRAALAGKEIPWVTPLR